MTARRDGKSLKAAFPDLAAQYSNATSITMDIYSHSLQTAEQEAANKIK